MYPSLCRMAARASLSLDDGIRTVSCMATLPLRMRVSMSAIGSVIVIASCLPSPARLGDAGNLTVVHHLPEADAAQPELAEHGARAPTAATPRVGPHPELGLPLLLLDQRLLGHAPPDSLVTGDGRVPVADVGWARRPDRARRPSLGTGSRRRRAGRGPRHRYWRWCRW